MKTSTRTGGVLLEMQREVYRVSYQERCPRVGGTAKYLECAWASSGYASTHSVQVCTMLSSQQPWVARATITAVHCCAGGTEAQGG